MVKQPESKSKSYGEWQAEKEGHPTHRGSIRADIDRAIRASTTERDFIRVMTEMGYEFKTRAKDGQQLKYPALKPPGAKGYFRFHKLGGGVQSGGNQRPYFAEYPKASPLPGGRASPVPSVSPTRKAQKKAHRFTGPVFPILL